MQILPGILAYDEVDFRKHILHKPLRAVAPMFHVDVLDGTLINASCWADPDVIARWNDLPDIELHCMVNDPAIVAERWREKISTLKRVIVHREIGASLTAAIANIHSLQLEVVLAVNPKTPVDNLPTADVEGLMIMGVEPGKSGQTFLGESILAKIRRTQSLYPTLPIAVDGGASDANILALAKAGVSRCVATSALWKAENPVEAYQDLVFKIATNVNAL